ncbi:MAG: L-threonylcarbamoyladenylate synthase [Acidobacteriaceae bacterium]|nr:L-threonylcarbamoyladenylate synthase [Acidobacteriaceae bacterium]
MESETLHLQADNPADIVRAADLLRTGRLVAFPTETVYGLGANALDAAAVARIFAAKQRPAWDPLIVHLATASQLTSVAELRPELMKRIGSLVRHFWPGPLTLLLPKTDAVPDAVTAGRPLVGVRLPSHPAARRLLEEARVPVAAPSANTFGHTSPTTAQHVLDDLDGRIEAVLDGGATSIGVESTVLDPTQTPMILYRPGAITASQIEAATGVAVLVYQPAVDSSAAPQALPSPGVGIRHYAPRARFALVDAAESSEETFAALPQLGERLGVLLPQGWKAPADALIYPWGRWDEPESLASLLFAGLRALDDLGATMIVAPLPPRGGIGDALRDRMEKAARTH